MMYGSESELRVACGNILHSVRFGEKNINFNTNYLDFLNCPEQSFLEWKISETRIWLREFYYSAICTMKVSYIFIDNPEVFFVSKLVYEWGKRSNQA